MKSCVVKLAGFACALGVVAQQAASAQAAPTSLMTFGSEGSGSGELYLPLGLACDTAGNVYVADSNNYRISVFDSQGNHLASWGTFGSGPGQFNVPTDVAVHPSGTVFVVDQYNHRVQKFRTTGEWVLSWGSRGTGPGQFDHPMSIAADADNVYVGDTLNRRIQRFSRDGDFLMQWPVGSEGAPGWPGALTLAPNGDIYVVDRAAFEVQRFTPNGQLISAFSVWQPSEAQSDVLGVVVDASSTVYVSDLENHRIEIYTQGGTLLGSFGKSCQVSPSSPCLGDMCGPSYLCIAPDGTLLVSEQCNNRVQRFSWAPALISTMPWGSVKSLYR